MNSKVQNFNLDYGTKPTTTKLDYIDFEIHPETMVDDYADAYLRELRRRNPLKFIAVKDKLADIKTYFRGILKIRVQSITNDCPVWRQAKRLVIPAWLQFVISQIGQIVDYEYGLVITPKFDFDYDISEMLEFSNILESFMNDGVSMFKDAFPRDHKGDTEVMKMAVLDGYVKSMTSNSHPLSSYVNAFVGAKVSSVIECSMLYRVRYDDVSFIRSMLLNDSSIF